MKRLCIILFLVMTLLSITLIPVFAEEQIAPPAPPCAETISNEGCLSTETAIGILKTKPESVVTRLVTFLLSVSGGLALLSFMTSGYKLITSQGNADTVKGAQEILGSTIAGLLFIILSFTLLQFIGIDILHLPGFS